MDLGCRVLVKSFELAEVAYQDRSSVAESNNEESTNKERRWHSSYLPILDSLLWSVPLPRLRHSRVIWISTASSGTLHFRVESVVSDPCADSTADCSGVLTGLFSPPPELIDLRLLNNRLEARRRHHLRSGGPSTVARSRIETLNTQASIR